MRNVPPQSQVSALVAALVLGVSTAPGCDAGGASSDAGRDAATEAGSPAQDAGTDSRTPEPDAGDAGRADGEVIDGLDCTLGPDDQAIEPIVSRSDRNFAVSVHGNQVEVLWARSGCGLPSRGMGRLSFRTDEPIPSSQALSAGDGCEWRQHPALLQYTDPRRASETVLEAFYTRREDGRFVPVLHELSPGDEQQTLPGFPQTQQDARGLAAAVLNGRAVLAWVGASTEEAAEQGRSVHTQLVHFQATAHTLLDPEHEQRPDAVAIAELGGESGQRHAVVAWASHAQGEAGGIFLSTLGPGGAPDSDPRRLLDAHGAAARVAVTGHPRGGGALAYVVAFDDTTAHVRLQRLDEQGALLGPAQQITPPSTRALDVSLAPYGAGYVLAYRRLAAIDGIEPVLQLAFTDSGGIPIGTLDLAHAEPSGGPTAVATASDGRMVVAWVDVGASGSRLKLFRGTCR